jgi:hypothetical protein
LPEKGDPPGYPSHAEAPPGVVVDSGLEAAYRFRSRKENTHMSVMCSLAACKAQTGMCGHEKAMLSVVLLAAIGIGAYFLLLG